MFYVFCTESPSRCPNFYVKVQDCSRTKLRMWKIKSYFCGDQFSRWSFCKHAQPSCRLWEPTKDRILWEPVRTNITSHYRSKCNWHHVDMGTGVYEGRPQSTRSITFDFLKLKKRQKLYLHIYYLDLTGIVYFISQWAHYSLKGERILCPYELTVHWMVNLLTFFIWSWVS